MSLNTRMIMRAIQHAALAAPPTYFAQLTTKCGPVWLFRAAEFEFEYFRSRVSVFKCGIAVCVIEDCVIFDDFHDDINCIMDEIKPVTPTQREQEIDAECGPLAW